MPRRTPRRSQFAVLRSALTAWLSRPLADFHLVLAVCGLLTVLGLVMVLSASTTDSLNNYGSSYIIFAKQFAYVLGGLLLFWLALRLPTRTLRRLSIPAMVISLLLLILVLIPGVGAKINNAYSWFKIGQLSFQPVEPAKVALVLWGAHVLATKRGMLHQWRHLLVPLVPAALLMFALLMLQPDLGSTITLAIIVLSLLWFAGASIRLFGVIALGAVTGAIALAMMASYRLERLTSFLSPGDNLDASYQANQALYALADGGLFGVGLGRGSAKWSYLPNVHNDFIFAVIGEELGLIGAVMVLILFGLLAYVGLRISLRNTDPWVRLVSSTLTVWLVSQAAINIGYVVNLLPVTGLTLPMISSGGTSAAVTLLVFGILANNARQEPEAVAALRSLGPGRVGRLLRLPAPEPYRPQAKRKPIRLSTPPRQGGRPVRAATPQPAQQRRRGSPAVREYRG